MENNPSISSDLIRGHIDTIILHILLETDKFAQQISDDVALKSENAYTINQATLYSSLKRLESLKLVSSYWHDYDGGRRKFFSITEQGKNTVKNNLSSWEYSRSVIDKLMDFSPAPVIVAPLKSEPSTTFYAETPIKKPENIKSQNTESETAVLSDEREKNFRNILNGLIEISKRNTQVKPEKTSVELKPIVSKTDDNISAKTDIMKFNETINETDYNANKANFNGKIDYGDLTLKAEKEGYSIKISQKDSARPHGNVLVNKLNFTVSAIILVVALIEFGILYAFFNDAFRSTSIVVLSAISLIPLFVFGIIYFFNRQKLGKNKIAADSILTAAITAFNLILINLAVVFLFELDFSDTATVLATLIIPFIYYIDLVLFFVFRFTLSTKKFFFYK